MFEKIYAIYSLNFKLGKQTYEKSYKINKYLLLFVKVFS